MNKKIEIAKEYIEMHSQIVADEYEDSSNEEWLEVFNNLSEGAFGEVTINQWNESEVEISRFDTDCGQTKIFNWYI